LKRILVLVMMMIGAIAIISGCEEKKVVQVTGDAPAAPTGVTSVTGDHQVTIEWRGNNDNGQTAGYGVYRYTRTVNSVDQYELLGKVTASEHDPIPSTDDVVWYSYVDHNVTNGTTYYYAVDAYNEFGESDLSIIDAMDTPRPQGTAVVRDFHQYPNSSGFQLSSAQVMRYDSPNADVYFEYDSSLNTYFILANLHVDIQDYGPTSGLTSVNYVPASADSAWSKAGYLELVLNHAYLVWTADDHYAVIRLASIDNNGALHIEWAYQTDPANPELKPRVIVRPIHDANYGRRSG
jgi:hypothetical protein